MKKLLVAAIAAAAFYGAPALAADMPTKAPPIKADHESPLDFTIAFGGSWNSGPPVQSSSGFYTGEIRDFIGFYYSFGASVPVGKVGVYDVRVGPTIERMQGHFHFSGLAGGVPETLSGRQGQWNYLATIMFSTKIGPTSEFYFGPVLGYASVSTHGTPCVGCPQYRDPGTFVWGGNIGIEYNLGPDFDVGYTVSFRSTSSTDNDTNSAFEKFHNGANNTIMGGIYFKYSPSSPYTLFDPKHPNIFVGSDIRLKRNVHLLTTLENGLKIYSFKYLWDDAAYVGVMAQDLLANPAWRDAVVTPPNGFYVVNYGALGLRMNTLEAWQAQGLAAIRSSERLSVTKEPQALQPTL